MDEAQLKNEIVSAQEIADFQIQSQSDYEVAADYIFSLDGIVKKIKNYWKEPKEKAHQAHKAITAKEKDMITPVESAKMSLKKKINDWLMAEERKRREDQARISAERIKKIEEEKERLKQAAIDAEWEGETEKAEEIKATEVHVPEEIIEEQTKTRIEAGSVSVKKTKGVKITNMKDFLLAVACGDVPLTVIEIKENKLKSYVNDFGIESVSGCEIFEEVNANFRRSR